MFGSRGLCVRQYSFNVFKLKHCKVYTWQSGTTLSIGRNYFLSQTATLTLTHKLN